MSILVRHAMTEAPRSAPPDATVVDAAKLMRHLDVGVLPIADDDRLVGLLTDRDLVVRVIADGKDPQETHVIDIATTSPVTVTPDTQLSDARDLMARHQVRRLPVMKGEKLVGILSLGDIAIADASKRAVGESLADISASTSTMEMGERPDRGTPDRVSQGRSEDR
jgi:CBS domain-containing protein